MVDARNPIVGRDAELDAVEAFLTTAQSHFVVLTFEGEAGIGKTTIWLETARRAGARGTRVLLTRPSEAEATLSYAALSDLIGPSIQFPETDSQRRSVHAVVGEESHEEAKVGVVDRQDAGREAEWWCDVRDQALHAVEIVDF